MYTTLFSYCDHKSGSQDHINTQPILKREELNAAWTEIRGLSEVQWASITEQFEAAQSNLTFVMRLVQPLMGPSGNYHQQLLGIGIWVAFKKHYPALRHIESEEIESLTFQQTRIFTAPTVCLCAWPERELLLQVFQEIEACISAGALSCADGLRVAQVLAIFITALASALNSEVPETGGEAKTSSTE